MNSGGSPAPAGITTLSLVQDMAQSPVVVVNRITTLEMGHN
jgi:hypothetical protein